MIVLRVRRDPMPEPPTPTESTPQPTRINSTVMRVCADGHPFPDTEVPCPTCGRPVLERVIDSCCSACGNNVSPADHYCPHCGIPFGLALHHISD